MLRGGGVPKLKQTSDARTLRLTTFFLTTTKPSNPPPLVFLMADNSSQQSDQEVALTKEQERFERIRDHIPVHLRPKTVPPPISNLSTSANVEHSRLHQIAENDQPPSEKMQAVVFVNALSKVFGPDSAIFVKNTLIRISKDRRYGYVIGPNRFSSLELLKGTEKAKLLVFVVSTASGGNRALGVYRSCNVKLLDITPEESFYRALPEEAGFLKHIVFRDTDSQNRRSTQEERIRSDRGPDGVFWESRDHFDQQTWDAEVRKINNSPTKVREADAPLESGKAAFAFQTPQFDQVNNSSNHTAQALYQPTPSNRAIYRQKLAFPKSGGRDITVKRRAEEIPDHDEVRETTDRQEGPSGTNVMGKIDFDTSHAAQLARRELSVGGTSQEELEWLVAMKGNTDQVGSFDAQAETRARLPASQMQNALDGGLDSTAGDSGLPLFAKKAMRSCVMSSNGVMGSYKSTGEDLTSSLRGKSAIQSLTSMISATSPESDSQTAFSTLRSASTMKIISPTMQQNSNERQPEPSTKKPADPAAPTAVPESQSHTDQQKAHSRDIGSSQKEGAVGSGPSARTDPSTDRIGIIRGWCTVLLDMDEELLAAAGLRITRPRNSARIKGQGFSHEETLLNLLKTSRGVSSTVSSETLSTFGIEIIPYQTGTLIASNKGATSNGVHHPGTGSSNGDIDVPLPGQCPWRIRQAAPTPACSPAARSKYAYISTGRANPEYGLTIALPKVGGSQQPAAGDGFSSSVKASRGGESKGKKRGSTVGPNSQAPQQASNRPSGLGLVPTAPLRDHSSEPMDWAPFAQEPLIDDRGSPIRVDSEELPVSEEAVQGGNDGAAASNVAEEATSDHVGPPNQGTSSVQPEEVKEQKTSGSTASTEAKPAPGASSQKPGGDTAEDNAKSRSKSRSKTKGRANQKKSDVESNRLSASPATSRTTTNDGSQDNPQATTPSALPQSTSSEEKNTPPLQSGPPHVQHPTSDVPGAGGQSEGEASASITQDLDKLSLLQPD
ncbi:hypothetical protein FS837_012134 [Tulasnella sp. UAMH 9824]|nr:hypothetical protein FS837_012134 [Tulasnella sp. UAMH 9824]